MASNFEDYTIPDVDSCGSIEQNLRSNVTEPAFFCWEATNVVVELCTIASLEPDADVGFDWETPLADGVKYFMEGPDKSPRRINLPKIIQVPFCNFTLIYSFNKVPEEELGEPLTRIGDPRRL